MTEYLVVATCCDIICEPITFECNNARVWNKTNQRSHLAWLASGRWVSWEWEYWAAPVPRHWLPSSSTSLDVQGRANTTTTTTTTSSSSSSRQQPYEQRIIDRNMPWGPWGARLYLDHVGNLGTLATTDPRDKKRPSFATKLWPSVNRA